MSDGAPRSPDALRQLAEALRAESHVDGPWPILAVGWATVDLERAAADLQVRWPDLAPSDPARGSTHLGARAWVCRAPALKGDSHTIGLVLLEPSTEGRLAASLARHGEGPTAVWLDGSGAFDRSDPPRTSVVGEGPLGPERLVLGGPVAGPHVLLLGEPPGTIER